MLCILSFLICKAGIARESRESNSKLANACETLRTVLVPECGCCFYHLYHHHQSFIYPGIQMFIEHVPSARYFLVLWWDSKIKNIKSFQELKIYIYTHTNSKKANNSTEITIGRYEPVSGKEQSFLLEVMYVTWPILIYCL